MDKTALNANVRILFPSSFYGSHGKSAGYENRPGMPGGIASDPGLTALLSRSISEDLDPTDMVSVFPEIPATLAGYCAQGCVAGAVTRPPGMPAPVMR